MPETARSKPLEIWFQDEARVGQQGTLTRIWAERGTRPRAPRDTRYIWSYIFGAVCPERAEAAALIMPHADTQAMSAHLAEIAKTVASGEDVLGDVGLIHEIAHNMDIGEGEPLIASRSQIVRMARKIEQAIPGYPYA